MSSPDLFRWTDQTLVDYVNWSENQPGTDNCIEMDIDIDGRWSADNCNDNSAFVCKNPVCKLLLTSHRFRLEIPGDDFTNTIPCVVATTDFE